MIRSKLRRLRFEKEEHEGRKLTYEVIQSETGLASATIAALLKPDSIERINGQTLNALCKFFRCDVGDLLEYVPDEEKETVTT